MVYLPYLLLHCLRDSAPGLAGLVGRPHEVMGVISVCMSVKSARSSPNVYAFRSATDCCAQTPKLLVRRI